MLGRMSMACRRCGMSVVKLVLIELLLKLVNWVWELERPCQRGLKCVRPV
jgi:hypothetical protein